MIPTPVQYMVGEDNLTEMLMKCFPHSLAQKWKENKILWCFSDSKGNLSMVWMWIILKIGTQWKIREGKNQNNSSFNSLSCKTVQKRKKIGIQWMSFFKWQTKPMKHLFWQSQLYWQYIHRANRNIMESLLIIQR